MKIAFVGKGGSGKTTLSCLFAQFVSNSGFKTLLIDGDVNIHCPRVLGLESEITSDNHLSNPLNASRIRKYLIGNNTRIKDLKSFRKTTPPSTGSGILKLDSDFPEILKPYIFTSGNLGLSVLGTYDDESIGTSCYHVNLSILENILSHSTETEKAVIVVDMVAGTDSFANTLHAQFDLLVLCVEPTLRGVAVWEQFKNLAQSASVLPRVAVVGNKVRGLKELEFLKDKIPSDVLLGVMSESDYLRQLEMSGEILDISKLENDNRLLLANILQKAVSSKITDTERLRKLCELHLKYCASPGVVSEFGDLSAQALEPRD